MKHIILIISLLSIISCRNKEVALGMFDKKTFREDRAGCNGQREKQIDELKDLKPNILGLTENQVVENLGKYDIQVLSRRNEKVFVYFLEPGEQCLAIQNKTQAQTMVVRFNAASLVKEINFQVGTPLEMQN